jgi:hypothetical protein
MKTGDAETNASDGNASGMPIVPLARRTDRWRKRLGAGRSARVMEHRHALAVLTALIALLPAAQEPSPPDFAAALQRCAELERRNPLRYHVQGWEELAATRDPRAIAELAARYAKPPLPKEESRYLIAVSAAAKGGDAATVDAFDAWRKGSREPEDAWLWYQALALRGKLSGPDELARIAREEAEPVLRGAAIEALVQFRSPLYRAILEASSKLPEDPEDQCALIGALATGLSRSGNSQTRVTSEWQKVAYSVTAILEREDVPRAAKLVIARHLAKALEAERVVLEADAWRALLAGRKQEAKEKRGEAPVYARPRFFGVEASGERICYVIDLSDSMCEPIPEALKAKHARPPVTPGAPKDRKGPPDADDIPWHLVETRFDLAREHLRLSLGRLTEEQSFCIVTFGDRAELLDGLEGMTKASHANTRKAMKALDEIEIGAALPDRPHGTLLGGTNIHAALRTAFRLVRKGLVEEYEYVDRRTFLEGCDTIFFLSDGDPTWDDYVVKDVDYGDGWTGDPESRQRQERTPELNYIGPYANWPRLLEEAERLNMFREVEIHCISIGDADATGLSRLAAIGLGTVTRFGP